jgi:hemolysin III
MENGFYSKREEIANAITHGVGACLAIASLVILIVFAALHGSASHVVGFSIFGASLVILYLASTLYHSLTHQGAKKLFRKFDHIAIYLLIAGTYTPFCLAALKGWIGWTLFGIVWGCAVIGIVVKSISVGKFEVVSTVMYVLMGWVVIFAIKPLYNSISSKGFILLMLGGVFYTAGTFFFIKDKNKYFHSIWHLFVLAGSICHFFAVIALLE